MHSHAPSSRSSRRLLFAVAASVSLALSAESSAHGDVHETIARITQQIASTPDDAQLYMSRGTLHASHEDWPSAIADFEKAAELNPDLSISSQVATAEILLLSGKHIEARAAADAILIKSPETTYAFGIRAKSFLAEKQFARAVEDFQRQLAATPQPEPSLILECSKAEEAAGDPAAALRTLDAGIAKLGPLVTFIDPAIALDEKAGRIDAALARVEKLMATLQRKERWLVRKAALLEKAGRLPEARAALTEAAASLETLPPERRYVAATIEFSRQLNEYLTRLETR